MAAQHHSSNISTDVAGRMSLCKATYTGSALVALPCYSWNSERRGAFVAVGSVEHFSHCDVGVAAVVHTKSERLAAVPGPAGATIP